MSKTIIYQLFTRLYGNKNTTRKHNGTLAENGCGKMNDLTNAELKKIAQLGVTHIWYTGVIRHASTTDYPFISHKSNANVVKGKAGSPYAICDYYDIDPDLAERPEKRLDEFKALVERTHANGMKCIIDFVPNHVARNYFSDSHPEKEQLGATDNPNVAFDPNNNFYYIPGCQFVAPQTDKDAPYIENPAKASGNDAFTASPSIYDWYETVKLNYGVDYSNKSQHFEPKPNTWFKMRDILMFWTSLGIDGFRVDMAEMVPVEFWTWVIGQIVMRHPNTIFIAETYNPDKYNEYIKAGFNLLYDKCNFYDTVRDIMQHRHSARHITDIWQRTPEISRHMLYFLENHDEQRLASDFFIGNADKAKAGVILTNTFGNGASMIYFGQELGERGMDEEGFSGRDGRTTIFDYWAVDSVQKFITGKADKHAKDLRQWYANLLNTVQKHDALAHGKFYDLMWINQKIFVDPTKIYTFLRYNDKERFLIALNFSNDDVQTKICIPEHAWQEMGSTWNESLQPVNILNTKQYHQRTSVNNTISSGIELFIPADDGIILKL
ncbi:MAG: alpha amylase C-terminal domain-containing protein [Bacteroidales bacterium]|nr:alpha amylase C-terminal domain-containing protein [Bacteroidales bacterium]